MRTKNVNLFSAITFIALVLMAVSCDSGGKTIGENEKPVVNVVAKQVFDDFSQNEIAAKAKYGKKIIAVRGMVASIESDGDGAVVLINDGNAENVGVKCYFNEDQVKSTAGLQKGQPVKIIGIGSESLTIDYSVNDCRLGVLGEN